MRTDNGFNTNDAQDGFIYTQEVKNAEDTDILLARYWLLYADDAARTHYYRPKSTEETDDITDAIQAESNPDNFTGE